MQAKKQNLGESDAASRPLTLIARSTVLIFEGTWHFHNTSANAAQPVNESRLNFDYIVRADGNNFFVHPGDVALVKDLEERRGIIHTVRLRLIAPDRSTREIHLVGSMLPEHSTTSVSKIIRTKEAVARQATAKYHDLFVSIDQGFAIIEVLNDNNGRPFDYFIDQTNPALERLTGFKEITGKRLSEVLPEAPSDWFLTLDKIVQSKTPTRFTAKAKELGDVWYDIYAFPTGDASSHKLGILFTDITDRIQSEEKLREKQLKLEIAQREARVGIWTYYPAADQGMASQEWIELTGYLGSTENWSLEEFLSLVDPGDASALRQAFQSAHSQPGIEVEFRIQHPRRGLQWFLMRGAYVASDRAENDALMGSIIDITDRKAFEELKDQFIGIASHELKTPVTSIKAYAEILHDLFSRSGNSTQSKMMERMVNQIDRLTRLINNLLDTTKLAGGGPVLEPETFDLNKVIHDRVEEMQRTTTHNLIVRTIELPPVYADKDRIGQVLMNLLSNAIKYSPPRSDIIIESATGSDHIIVKVSDFGIGLSPELQEKIFDRFYRVNDARLNTIPGLGLGLFIASEIIRRHNGTMGVNSREGHGSEFYFTLPR